MKLQAVKMVGKLSVIHESKKYDCLVKNPKILRFYYAIASTMRHFDKVLKMWIFMYRHFLGSLLFCSSYFKWLHLPPHTVLMPHDLRQTLPKYV